MAVMDMVDHRITVGLRIMEVTMDHRIIMVHPIIMDLLVPAAFAAQFPKEFNNLTMNLR